MMFSENIYLNKISYLLVVLFGTAVIMIIRVMYYTLNKQKWLVFCSEEEEKKNKS